KPDSFLRAVAKEACGVELDAIYGVGAVMLNRDPQLAAKARAVLEEELTAQGLGVAGWRQVPVDSSYLGPIALKSLPEFNHLFVNSSGKSLEQDNAALFMARRKAELRLAEDKSFYISSLSTGILSY